jgi:peroxiredoxin
MKRVLMLLPVVLLSLAMVANAQLVAPGANTAPKVGEKAPDFELPTGQGQATLGLKDFAGKKKVLLTFFPAAFTGG